MAAPGPFVPCVSGRDPGAGHDDGWIPDSRRRPFAPEPEHSTASYVLPPPLRREKVMGGLIYLVGLIVVIMAILSLLGLR